MDFKNTLELHLDSMRSKDLNKFISIVKLEDIILIMPNGTLIREKEKALMRCNSNILRINDYLFRG